MSEYKDQAECDYNEVLEQKGEKELFSEQEILEGQKKLEACCVDVKLPAPSWTTISNCIYISNECSTIVSSMWECCEKALRAIAELINKSKEEYKKIIGGELQDLKRAKELLLRIATKIHLFRQYTEPVQLDAYTLGLTRTAYSDICHPREFRKEEYKNMNDLLYEAAKESKYLRDGIKNQYRQAIHGIITKNDTLLPIIQECYDIIFEYKTDF